MFHHRFCSCGENKIFTQISKEYFDEIRGTYCIDRIVVPLLNIPKSLLKTCIYNYGCDTKLENHQA